MSVVSFSRGARYPALDLLSENALLAHSDVLVTADWVAAEFIV